MAAETKQKKKKYRVIHNHELCKGCGLCIEFCPVGGIEADILGKAQFVRQENCTGCRRCVWYCPDFANWVEEITEDEDEAEGEGEGEGEETKAVHPDNSEE